MRKFYQTDWLGIQFASVSPTSKTCVADTGFYKRFYGEFFRRYAGLGDLDPAWIKAKQLVAEFIAGRSSTSDRLLSIGCGLGIVEKYLHDSGYRHLDVTETSNVPLQWLRQWLPPERIHVGLFPACIAADIRYDLIYLSGVDYCFDQAEWIGFLRQVGGSLAPTGKCLIFCASVQESSLMRPLKEAIKDVADRLGLRSRGQLWGWQRSEAEHRAAMTAAGFRGIADGYVTDGIYWIEGGTR